MNENVEDIPKSSTEPEVIKTPGEAEVNPLNDLYHQQTGELEPMTLVEQSFLLSKSIAEDEVITKGELQLCSN